jgi:hypothetical protein
VRARGAGGNETEVRTASTILDRHQTRAHVSDQRRYGKRRYFAWTAFRQNLQLGFEGEHAANTGPNHDSDPIAVLPVHINAGISESLFGRHEPKMRIAIVASRFLRIHVLRRIPVAHLGSNLAGKIRRIKE